MTGAGGGGAARAPRRWPLRQLLAACVLFSSGVVALATDVEGWNAVWYLLAWSGYLLAVDAAIHALGGRAFLAGRREELLPLLFWSIPFWFFFEAYNLRLQNWSYVFVLRNPAARAAAAGLAFATVLPACFFHFELVRTLGWWRASRSRPLESTRTARGFVVAVGVASVVAPLLWPRAAFWLVWGATFWIPDLINARRGEASLLADLARGDPSRSLQLATAGLWAGIVWEAFNAVARSKWIYTVPGFETAKVFEMPLPGYLGFPALALAAFPFWTLVRSLGLAPTPSRSGRAFSKPRVAVALIVAAVFSAIAYRAMVVHTVRSLRPLLSELDGLDRPAVERLRAAGVPTPERLERALARDGPARLAAATGVAETALRRAGAHARLALHKGMGTSAASLLRAAGIADLPALCGADPGPLAARLGELADARKLPPPRPTEIRFWRESACGRSRPAR